MFRNWLVMNEPCPHCHVPFGRGPGFFLGSIYINYGLTAMVVAVTYPVLMFGFGIQPEQILWPLMAFCVLFPLLFFPYARSLWCGFDEFYDPVESPPK